MFYFKLYWITPVRCNLIDISGKLINFDKKVSVTDITMKTKLKTRKTLKYEEKYFFNIILGLIQLGILNLILFILVKWGHSKVESWRSRYRASFKIIKVTFFWKWINTRKI